MLSILREVTRQFNQGGEGSRGNMEALQRTGPPHPVSRRWTGRRGVTQVRSTGPESGGRTSKHVCKQSIETQGWEDTAINEGGGGARPQRTWGATPADAAFEVQVGRYHRNVVPQHLTLDSVKAGFVFESDHWGSSDA